MEWNRHTAPRAEGFIRIPENDHQTFTLPFWKVTWNATGKMIRLARPPFFWLALLVGIVAFRPSRAMLTDAPTYPKVAAYQRPHTATLPGKTGRKPAEAADYLKVTTESPTVISFCLDTFGNNGAMCNLWGKAARGDRSIYTYRNGKPGEECVLELTPTNSAWVVRDVGGACARQACGAGAGVGQITFSLKNRVRKIHPCESEAAGATDDK